MARPLNRLWSALAMLVVAVIRFAVDLRESSTLTEHGTHAIAAPSQDESGDDEPEAALLAKQLTQITPLESMPIGNRFAHAEPQIYQHCCEPVDNWMLGTPMVLRVSISQ